jgi:hypothetical protein
MNLTETRAQARRFEQRIRELLAEGHLVREAVRRAYEEYPVMDVLRDEISDQIRREAETGYGEPLPSGITDRLFTQSWAPDKLILSERTTHGVLYVQQMVAKTIEERIKKNNTYKNTALAIFEGYGEGGVIPEQDIPKFLRELEQQGRHASIDMKEVRAMLREIRPRVEKLTTPGMRAAYSKMLNAIEDQSETALDNAIMAATQERTRYYAERIARTEMHRAYIDGFVARWDDNPDCIAYRWKLSSRHPCFDICDLYAKANLYGMGAGVFPKDKVPLLPAHPHCMCRLKPVIRGMLDNETPVERIEEGGREYLATLNLHQRRQLLGGYGEKDVAAGLSWTAKARGYSGEKLVGRLDISSESLPSAVKNAKIKVTLNGLGEAHIPVRKLTEYALNPEKDIHKAQAFEQALGYNLNNADKLIENIKAHIGEFELQEKPRNQFGKRYQVILSLKGENGKAANVVTGWIQPDDGSETHLTSIYVKRRGRKDET